MVSLHLSDQDSCEGRIHPLRQIRWLLLCKLSLLVGEGAAVNVLLSIGIETTFMLAKGFANIDVKLRKKGGEIPDLQVT